MTEDTRDYSEDTITLYVQADDLFPSSDDVTDGVDIEASVERYEEMMTEFYEKRFPGVHVNVIHGAGFDHSTIDSDEMEAVKGQVEEIFTDADWLVYESK